jgi:predicted porin
VTYTGSFSGLTVRGIWSARGVEATRNPGLANEIDPSDDDAYGLGLTYKNGPFAVGAVYQEITGNAAGSTRSQTEWFLGGSYDLGVVKLVATYQDGSDLANTSDNDFDLWTVGGIVPVGAAGSLHLSYGQSDFDNVSSATAKSFAVAYVHSLSKRTKVYAGYNRVNNDDNTNAGFGSQNDENQNIYGVGFNHSF